jgi:prevent-host-death family protein
MERIGVRELRQHASTWVRRAAAGETLEVTDRGRPVARLGPIPAVERGVEALAAAGRLRPAQGPLSVLDPLPAARAGEPDLSSALAALRADER